MQSIARIWAFIGEDKNLKFREKFLSPRTFYPPPSKLRSNELLILSKVCCISPIVCEKKNDIEDQSHTFLFSQFHPLPPLLNLIPSHWFPSRSSKYNIPSHPIYVNASLNSSITSRPNFFVICSLQNIVKSRQLSFSVILV